MSKSAIGDVPDSDYAGLADRIASSERHIAELEALVRSLRAELHDIVSLALVSHTKSSPRMRNSTGQSSPHQVSSAATGWGCRGRGSSNGSLPSLSAPSCSTHGTRGC